MRASQPMNKILVINPGSTSTKIAVYEDHKQVLLEVIRHTAEEIGRYDKIADQYEFRKQLIIDKLNEHGISEKDFAAIIGRGGMVRPLESGVYNVNEKMLYDLRNCIHSAEHASNLGGVIAYEMTQTIGCPAFIADPVAVDELSDVARISGLPELPRRSIFHALNHKAIARRYATEQNKKYEDLNLIVVHMGGGVSVGAHKHGKVVDVNQALDGWGPFSPERAGTLPAGDLVKLCFSGKYTQAEIKKMLAGKGGFYAHLGTTDAREVDKMVENGDKKAALILEAFCYSITKEIGAMLLAMQEKTDAVLLTGGIAYDHIVVDYIKKHVEPFAPVHVYPGEDEMGALADCALRALNGEETKVY